MRPHAHKTTALILARLPPMEKVNASFRAGTELWLATMQTALDKAWPHLLDLANAVKNLKFREAANQAGELLRVWGALGVAPCRCRATDARRRRCAHGGWTTGPMILLLIPLSKQVWKGLATFSVHFWRVSQKAISVPFGHVLRRFIQTTGQSLSENSDDVAERVAGVLGPLIGIQLLGFLLVCLMVYTGIIGAPMLETFYVAWLFRLVGVLAPPQAEFPVVVLGSQAGGVPEAVSLEAVVDSVSSGGGWFW
jgi:hypothetical protein